MKRTVLLVLGALALTMASANAANIFWVSFHADENTPSAAALAAGFDQAPDAGYTQLLSNNGHNVTRLLSSAMPDVARLNGADLVIISRSVPSGHYETDAATAAWNSITAPTMILGGYILRNNRLGFTTGTTIPDTVGTVTLSIASPSHPIFQGIPLDANNNMATPFATSLSFDGIVQRGISVNTNPLAGGGTTLATVGSPGDASGGMIIGEWEAGSVMATTPPDTLGGHRMVFLTGSREQNITSEAAGILDLAPDGARLFLNAVEYMAVPEPSTVALFLLAGGGLLLSLRRRKA